MQAPEEYRGQREFFDGDPPLSSRTGAAIIVGLGVFFTVYGFIATYFHLTFNKIMLTSEYFSTAGRSIGIGMTACAIVSSWTWSATILQSSNVAWRYGVSGSYWYAAGASVQIFLFAILAYKFKKYARNAHTIGEVVYARWGPACHKVFLYFFLLTNLLVLAMLIGGGARVFQELTGLDRGTSSFFIRMTFFTGSGGLITGYISAYLHVAIVFSIMTFFVLYVFFFSPDLGSSDAMYNHLSAIPGLSDQVCIDFGYDPETQTCGGIEGNLEGSYLTLQSMQGLAFGIINLVGNFGAVFVDQSYWQVAISSHSTCVFPGFILGGLLWFAVPFCMSTALGLANAALQLPTNDEEADNGLVAVAASVHLLGNRGGKLLMIQLFMAICAAGSSELNSVSSIIVYDIYRIYIKPHAKSRDIKYYARLTVLGSGSMLGGLAVLVNGLGISLGWLYLCMGVLIGSAVFPISCCVLWKKANAKAAMISSLLGQALAVSVWISLAKMKFGSITLTSTGDSSVMLVGNLVALLSSTVIMTAMSFHDPDDFDFKTLNDTLTLVLTNKDTEVLKMREASSEEEAQGLLSSEVEEARGARVTKQLSSSRGLNADDQSMEITWFTLVQMICSSFSSKKGKKYVRTIVVTFVILILWPILCAPVGVFSVGYFRFWVALTVTWSVLATVVVIVLPIVEGWDSISCVMAGISSRILALFQKLPSSPQESADIEISDRALVLKNNVKRSNE